MRQISSRRMPTELSDYFANHKVELFNMWLNSNKSWDQTTLMVRRSMECRNTTTKGWEAVQGKTLKGKYSEAKFQQIVKSRRESGLFYEDEDFPNDDDETWLV